MKQNLRSLTCYTGVIIMGLLLSFSSMAQNYKDGILQGTFRIKLQPHLGQSIQVKSAGGGQAVTTGVNDIDMLNSRYSAVQMERIFPYSPQFEDKHQKYGLHLWYKVTITDEAKTHSAISAYASLASVDVCEPVREISLIHPMSSQAFDKSQVLKATSEMPFNDPYLPMQWHYNNTGQTNGLPGADINAFEAWKINTGSNKVIVSIHDEGVDVNHEDLHEAMWVNEAELNGEPNVDDDGNGYKDDIYGFNFGDNMGEIAPGHHGSHVAGTVGAINNNGIGVSGVAGGTGSNDGVRIMSCQILGGVSQGNLPSSFVYAADNGAVISQNSWGYKRPDYVEQAVLDAIDYFIQEAGSYAGSPMKGGVVIFAAGNDNAEGLFYPGCYEEVIAVSALGSSNKRAGYTNYGTWVDLAAPGGDSDDNANMTDSQAEAGFSNGVLSCYAGNAYGYMDGTSMACPHVSGIAALVVSQHGHSGFSNTTLKNQLITAVNDIYQIEGNAPYKGKLGSGAIDAVLALKNNEGKAPVAITDLNMLGLAQDFAVLEWSVPADEDDGKPWEFEILYSKKEISTATLEYARRINLKNDWAVGEKVSFEVEGLEAMTEYYFAVRSIDRWGNQSDFSNQLSATTNEGPDAQIDEATPNVNLVVDATESTEASASFNIQNVGTGLLRWTTENHHVSSMDAYSIADVRYPKIKQQAFSGKANIQSTGANFDIPIHTYRQKPATDQMSYFSMWSGLYYIGEEDTSYTNSAAIRYYVSQEEGFNMTHLNALVRNNPERGPLVFEVREGADILDSKLIYAQEHEGSEGGDFVNIKLKEQLYFPQGSYFWLVLHVPSGNRYPIGAGVEMQPELSEMCYMSLNGGETWALFEDMYYNNLLVWAITPVSTLKPEQKYISINPESGETPSNETTTVDVSVDMSQLVNGTYKSNVVVYTNETEESMLRVPTQVKLSGHPHKIQGESIVDFGSVVLGNTKEMPVNIDNIGLGNFSSAYIEIDNPAFTVKRNYLGQIAALSGVQFKVVYNPTTAGNTNAVARIYNRKGDEFTFNLFGVAAEPPVMEISPAELSFDNLNIGDEVSGEFTITNHGNYPLEYFFPSFVQLDQSVQVDPKTCLFGYAAQINEDGALPNPAYEWVDIVATGTKVVPENANADYFYYPVELDFDFPFFGKRENSLFITDWGMITFDQNSVFNVLPPHYKLDDCPDRFISALGNKYRLNDGGNIYYQSFGDKFVVQYDKVIWEGFDWGTGEFTPHEQTFQIVLHSNGNIDLIYKTLGGLNSDALRKAFIAIEDQKQDDGYFISDIDSPDLIVSDQTVVRFVNPGLGLVTELSNPKGKVQVGESVTVAFKASTEVLNVEHHREKLAVLSNDPQNNPGIFTIDLNVTGGGEPKVELAQTTLDFGKVFQEAQVVQPLWVLNSGRADADITSVKNSNSVFTIAAETPQILTPGRKLPFNVTLNTTQIGIYEDVVTILASDGTELTVALKAEVIEAPTIDLDIAEITETVASGTVKDVSFSVTNNGGNNLEVAPIGTPWMTVQEMIAPQSTAIKDFTYHVVSSDDENGPEYRWEDIRESGIQISNEVLAESYWAGNIELPFTFDFYGAPQNSVNIGANGVLCFNTYTNPYPFGGDLIPNTAEPNNLIAVMWGLNGPNTYMYEDAGIYYQVFEDKLIVQFEKYIDGFGMSDATSSQVILYANGTIKMQYEWYDAWLVNVPQFSQVGLENADGTEGVSFAAYEEGTIHDDLAVVYTPVEKYVVAPGAKRDFVATINAKELFAGSYSSVLQILNNTPNTSMVEVPVELTVTGEAKLVAPASVDFGAPMVVENPNAGMYDPTHQTYEMEFELKNEGTARFEITGFDLSEVLQLNSAVSFDESIRAYVEATDWMGNKVMQWMDLNNLPIFDWMTGTTQPIYVEPQSTLRFKAVYMPDGTMNAEGTAPEALADKLIINTDLADHPAIAVSLTAQPVLPPVMAISEDLLSVYAQDGNVVENHSVLIDNTAGNSDLHYNIVMDYTRNTGADAKEAAQSMQAVTAEPLQAEAFQAGNKVNATTYSDTYNRVLTYSEAVEPESKLGFGGAYQFNSATRYYAPENGFNLTHVRTWYAPEDWLESKITVTIMAGSPYISQCEALYSQDYMHVITEADHIGDFLTIELDQTQIFYPNEPFFVVFTYPTAVKYPQGVVETGDPVDGRFMYTSGSDWSDLAGSDFASKGWMTAAIEAEYKTGLWVELADNNNMEGTVKAGESLSLDFAFNAAYAELGDNYAVASVSSNDPLNMHQKINLHLLRNRAPEITYDGKAISVIENETQTLEISAIDHEQDTYELVLNDAPEFVSTQVAEGTMTITLEPGYDAAGTYACKLVATDAFGNASTIPLSIMVVNSNRVPEVLMAIEDQEVIMEYGVVDIDLAAYITDPDAEQLSFEMSHTDNNVVEVFVAGNKMMLNPVGIGESVVTLTATDPNGAAATLEFTVTVRNRTGLDANEKGKWMLYPNPATTHVTVSWGNDVQSDVQVRLLTVGGTVIANEVVNAAEHSQYDLKLNKLTPGVYFVELIEDEQSFVYKLIKK
ncbi:MULTISPECIES: S8 family serine peptidase [unclassified Carboxylicivirga]|uniref:S8 family serine peptidase n=1 Tax=Carboxylicivirga TaxID=1628153 RepID=UPI003D34F729